MTIEELYGRIGGDYADILGRLRSERIVGRLIAKLPADGSCEALQAAWVVGDDDAAFRAAHTLKGVYANLSLGQLGDLAVQVTEALRPGNQELKAQTDVDALVARLCAEHAEARNQVEAYLAQEQADGVSGLGS